MLKKKERRDGKANCVLENGLYVRTRDGIFRVTKTLRFEEQQKLSVVSIRGLFWVIDNIVVPLSGVGSVEVEKYARVIVPYVGEIL